MKKQTKFGGKNNLKDDPKEQNNIYNSGNAKVISKREELKNMLINKMKEIYNPLLKTSGNAIKF